MRLDPAVLQELVEEVILQLVVAGDVRVPAERVDALEREVYTAALQALLREEQAVRPFPSASEAPRMHVSFVLAERIIHSLHVSRYVAGLTADDAALRWKILRIAALPVARSPLPTVLGGGGSVPPPLEGGGGVPAEARVSDAPPIGRPSDPDPNRRQSPIAQGKRRPRRR